MKPTTVPMLCALVCLAACEESPPMTEDSPEVEEVVTMEDAPAAVADAEVLDALLETRSFRNGHPRSITILPDASGVLFLRSGARSTTGALHFFDVEAGVERELLTAETLLGGASEELSAEEAARRERMRLRASGIASYRLSPDGSQLLVPLSGRLFLVERARIGEADAVREIESDAGAAIDPRFSPTGSHIATVRAGDLYVIDVATGAERRLTTRANNNVTNGLAEFVAQEEMDRMGGFWWSPDGGSIAFEQADTTAVERMHILDPMHPERAPRGEPYPRPGAVNAAVTLGVVAISGGAPRFVSWDREAYEYLASVTWPAQGPLTLLLQNREQQRETLFAVDVATLELRELLTEEDDAWLNLDSTVPRWLADGSQFLWSTEREGGWQLELRAADGSLVRALTTTELGYRHVVGVDEAHGDVWVAAGPESSETQIYSVPINGVGEPTARTEGQGEHSATLAKTGTLWVHSASPIDGPRTTTVRRDDGEEIATLTTEAEDFPYEPNLSFATVGERELRTVIIRPRNHQELTRYPVLLHVYGGPHARYVTATQSRYLMEQWQADHNFIVVCIDGRGTPARGREWERSIRGDFITVPLEDQIAGLQALAMENPDMDIERLGVWGWSFGGYFSAMAALRRPDIFRAAVAGAPVSEWRDYDTHYTERYLGLPEDADTDEGPYRRSSVLTYAGEVEASEHRPLLIFHGTADDNVYFSHALKLQDALFRAGRPVELAPLSGLTHMASQTAQRRRMHQRIIAFFEENLRR